MLLCACCGPYAGLGFVMCVCVAHADTLELYRSLGCVCTIYVCVRTRTRTRTRFLIRDPPEPPRVPRWPQSNRFNRVEGRLGQNEPNCLQKLSWREASATGVHQPSPTKRGGHDPGQRQNSRRGEDQLEPRTGSRKSRDKRKRLTRYAHGRWQYGHKQGRRCAHHP